jgi:hypothetical protein
MTEALEASALDEGDLQEMLSFFASTATMVINRRDADSPRALR